MHTYILYVLYRLHFGIFQVEIFHIMRADSGVVGVADSRVVEIYGPLLNQRYHPYGANTDSPVG